MSVAKPATVTPNARELAAMLRSARGLRENSQTLSVLMASPRLARPVLGLALVGATIASAHFSGGRTREVLRDSARDFAIFHHNAARHPSLSPAGERVRSLESPEEDGMRSLRALAASSVGVGSIIAAGISGSAFAQDAVQWRIEDGGNGHWYATTAAVLAWIPLQDWCTSRGGHLATLTTSNELAWMKGRLPVVNRFVGGFQDTTAADYSEPSGGWRWVTNEPLIADPDIVPVLDDCPGGVVGVCGCGPVGAQNVLFFTSCCGVRLDDVGDGLIQNCDSIARGGIIEWSADCNADGIVDYGQIRAGELADTNANNIPDCCEAAEGCNPCLADIDESGAVNAVDLAAILSNWGTNGGKYPRADIDGNGDVDGADLAAVLSAWGPCP